MTLRLGVKRGAVILGMVPNETIGPKPCFSHGVVMSADDPDYYGLLRKGKCVIDRAAQQRRVGAARRKLPGRWLYGGMLLPHFGHVLAECVHRLWAWRDRERDISGVIFVPPPHYATESIPDFVFEIFRIFGVDQARIEFIYEQAAVEELLVPEPGSHLFGEPRQEYLDYLQGLMRFWWRADETGELPRKVFVSRRGYLFSGRVAGMDYVADLLSNGGYQEFRPQENALSRQLAVIASAEKIVFEEGSAVHLMELLGRAERDVFLIRRRSKYLAFDSCLKVRARRFGTFDMVSELPPLSSRPVQKSNRLAVLGNFEELLGALVREGFTTPVVPDLEAYQRSVEADMMAFLLNARSYPGFPTLLPEFLEGAALALVRR